jgi:hypothetical protein
MAAKALSGRLPKPGASHQLLTPGVRKVTPKTLGQTIISTIPIRDRRPQSSFRSQLPTLAELSQRARISRPTSHYRDLADRSSLVPTCVATLLYRSRQRDRHSSGLPHFNDVVDISACAFGSIGGWASPRAESTCTVGAQLALFHKTLWGSSTMNVLRKVAWYRQGFLKLLYGPLALVISACGGGSTMCPQWILSPIVVEVRDAATGEPAATGATGTIRSGDHETALVLPSSTERLRLYSTGGPGTYDVFVQKPGYLDWRRDGVYVEGGNCGVEREVVVRADLLRP